MSGAGPSGAGSLLVGRLRWQRVAELVANDLRDRILSGALPDGCLLPKEEELRTTYPVSKPSLREAMRILEAEGLVTVRRGNTGGAVVHRPTSTNVAYTLAMVLRSKQVAVDDVGRALREVEPACAALCAARRDRRRAVLPALRAVHRQAIASTDDLIAATAHSRTFHETLVSLCGNDSLIVVVGALEALWSTHETGWSLTEDPHQVPVEERRAALDVHGEMLDLIAAGDSAAVRDLAAGHLADVQRYPSRRDGSTKIAPLLIRDQMP